MKIQISNRHETAHPHIKTMIEYELDELSSRYDILGAEVILDREGQSTPSYFAEINLKLPGSTLVSKERSEKIEKSIDLAFKSLGKQLKKHKEIHFQSLEPSRTSAKTKSTIAAEAPEELVAEAPEELVAEAPDDMVFE